MAVGVFDRAESLTQVLDGLAAIEPAPPDVVLLSTCLDLPGATSGAGVLPRKTRWPEGWPVIAAVGKDGTRIPEGGYGNIVDFESWIGPAMSRDLSRRLSEGACLLFAATRDSTEEMRVCQTLIRHSVGQVQVHDYVA